MALKLVLPATINTVDTMGGGSLAAINVDFRQQPGCGGLFSAEFLASLISGGTVSFPAYVDVVDGEGGGSTSVVNVDFRQVGPGTDYGSGGFFEAEVPTASLTALGAPSAAPTMGSAVAGALAGATYRGKVTYVTANGTESLPSAETSDVVATNSVPTVTSPPAATGATGYNVYLTNGATNTETLQNGSPIAIGTGYQLPSSGLVAGASPPAAAALAAGACTVTVAVGAGSLASGACTVTISQ